MSSDDDRRRINGHTLILSDCDWRCLQCHHSFDAANDANGWWCGDDCHGRHYGEPGFGAALPVPADLVGPAQLDQDSNE